MGNFREDVVSELQRAYRRRLLAVCASVLLGAVRPIRPPRVVLTERREPPFLGRESMRPRARGGERALPCSISAGSRLHAW